MFLESIVFAIKEKVKGKSKNRPGMQGTRKVLK